MIISRTIASLNEARSSVEGTKKVGFVATMGALHSGHLSLIAQAKKECDFVVVSVFVNPTQFHAGEDFDRYPRKEEADIVLCRAAGVDLLFLPTADELYKDDEPRVLAPAIAAHILEGAVREGHFDGVLTIVLKLLLLIAPQKAYFGKKDAQQIVLISKMVKSFFLSVEIVPCETMRESSGLALSSRNAYLLVSEKIEAEKLSKSLFEASKLVKQNQTNSMAIIEAIGKVLEPLTVDYIAVVDRKLNPRETIAKDDTIVLIAARVGAVRLIDNMWI
ncbi:pantothenate synthetase [Campylobacterota bacterium]|nr:pantothenate synthetase [Campylobacterota bacterium]